MSLAACESSNYKITNKGYAAKLAIKARPNLTLPTFPSFWLGGANHLGEMRWR